MFFYGLCTFPDGQVKIKPWVYDKQRRLQVSFRTKQDLSRYFFLKCRYGGMVGWVCLLVRPV